MVLLCCTSYQSYSDTTGDILDPSTISGTYEPCSGSDCWGGTSGGSNPSWNGGTARWGYGGGILAWNYALEQALAYAGINIDGFNYSWYVKNKDANATQGCVLSAFNWFCSGDGADYMRVSVKFYDADNNELWGKQYNLDGTYDWKYFTGQELFTDALSGGDVETVIIRAEGDDPGNWAGHYGPEFDVSASSVTLIYSNNPCWPDPLYSPTCDGYAEAYAAKQLEELMEELNAPVEETNVIETTPTQTISQSTTGSQPSAATGGNPEPTQEVAVQETVDTREDKKDSKSNLALARSLDAANNFDVSSVSGAPTADAGLDVAAAAEQQALGGTLDGSMDQTISGLGGLLPDLTSSEQNQQAPQTREERQERRERLKEITENRANEIAEENAEAESMDEQSQQQLEQLALMNYVPGFDTYGIVLNGGVYPDVDFYKPTTVPESKRGLRNGLAQQLLHEKMIDMQYRREQ